MGGLNNLKISSMGDFLSWNLTRRMHSLGYDGPTLMYIDNEEDLINDDAAEFIGAKPAILCSAAFRWFREKYNLDGYVSVDVWNRRTSSYRITGGIKGHIEADSYGSLYDIDSKEYEVYEEAELACLERLIEIVEQK
jgi:hypothetical protein